MTVKDLTDDIVKEKERVPQGHPLLKSMRLLKYLFSYTVLKCLLHEENR